jgi:hypothetical protein
LVEIRNPGGLEELLALAKDEIIVLYTVLVWVKTEVTY